MFSRGGSSYVLFLFSGSFWFIGETTNSNFGLQYKVCGWNLVSDYTTLLATWNRLIDYYTTRNAQQFVSLMHSCRYSGITHAMMENVTSTLKDVQASLWCLYPLGSVSV